MPCQKPPGVDGVDGFFPHPSSKKLCGSGSQTGKNNKKTTSPIFRASTKTSKCTVTLEVKNYN